MSRGMGMSRGGYVLGWVGLGVGMSRGWECVTDGYVQGRGYVGGVCPGGVYVRPLGMSRIGMSRGWVCTEVGISRGMDISRGWSCPRDGYVQEGWICPEG